MKCFNCHGEIEEGKTVCDLCGVNINEQKNMEALAYKGVNKLIKYKKITTIIVIAVILLFLASFFVPSIEFTLPLLGAVFLLPLIEKGIVLGFIGFISYMLIKIGMKNIVLKNNGMTTIGKVIEYNLRRGRDYLIAEFEVNSKKYRLTSEYKKYVEVGQEVVIKYSSKNPYDAIILGNNNRGIALILGIFFLILVIVFFFFA